MLFTRKTAAGPAKVLRLIRNQDWRQGETLRVTQKPRWDANPQAKRLVIRRQSLGELALTPMRWGLTTDHTHGEPQPRPLTTVRADTIAEQVEWRRLLNTQRCLVPADQFFEWKRIEGIKTREFSFRLKSGQPMMIAGLWNRSPDRNFSFASISCEANPLVSLIHARMPVILEQASITAWFNPETSLETLMSLLRPIRQGELEAHAVSQARTTHRPNQPSLFDRRAA